MLPIPHPSGAGPNPLPWDLLKFNQIGLYDIRRRIGVFPSHPGVYEKHRARFDAADLAWFASGLSSDVIRLAQDENPPEFLSHINDDDNARDVIRTNIRKLTFDLAALWDRAYGGATLILHVEGTTGPNTPKSPEYIKSDVYFPGYLIQAYPNFSPIISELVQKFIVNIGMSVIEKWEQCAGKFRTLTQGKGGPIPNPYQSRPMQPEATPRGSSDFVYTGSPPRRVAVDEYGYEVDELSTEVVEMLYLMETRDEYKEQLDKMISVLATTEEALAKSLAREKELRSELDNARRIPHLRW